MCQLLPQTYSKRALLSNISVGNHEISLAISSPFFYCSVLSNSVDKLSHHLKHSSTLLARRMQGKGRLGSSLLAHWEGLLRHQREADDGHRSQGYTLDDMNWRAGMEGL